MKEENRNKIEYGVKFYYYLPAEYMIFHINPYLSIKEIPIPHTMRPLVLTWMSQINPIPDRYGTYSAERETMIIKFLIINSVIEKE